MSVAPITRGNKVLHIRPNASHGISADKIDAWLEAAGVDVEVCCDVYRGLARLCRRGTDAPPAALVCIDDLGAAEFEFFSLASPPRCRAKVYVYGDERWDVRVDRAIELGAAGRATEQVIRTLTPAARRGEPSNLQEQTKAALAEPEAVPERTPPPVDSATVGEPAAPAPGSAATESKGVAERLAEAREGTVRVPWLRYGSTPSRTPPPRQRLRPEQPSPAPPDKPPPAEYEPLLTEEELRALIGDDIAAIAPAEHDSATHQDGAKPGEPS